MNEPKFHSCPICSNSVPHWILYPRSVCQNCYDQACDEQGRKLNFHNLSMSGGFEAIVADTKEKHPTHICYVQGIECWADEARFGGIVIQPYEGKPLEFYD